MSVREAFFTVCDQAVPAEGTYVSLYVSVPFYGGPEEGGWWGSDTHLVAYYHYPTQEQADAAIERINALCEELNRKEKRRFGEQCLREMEWCDARGLDYDYLPEVDGESRYYVTTEETPGSCERRGCRHYE